MSGKDKDKVERNIPTPEETFKPLQTSRKTVKVVSFYVRRIFLKKRGNGSLMSYGLRIPKTHGAFTDSQQLS